MPYTLTGEVSLLVLLILVVLPLVPVDHDLVGDDDKADQPDGIHSVVHQVRDSDRPVDDVELKLEEQEPQEPEVDLPCTCSTRFHL